MKLCCGDERARWGPAACPGWARASERERASLTDGRCNPAILPDAAHQNVPTSPMHLPGCPDRQESLVAAGVIVTAGTTAGRLRLWAVTPTTTFLCSHWRQRLQTAGVSASCSSGPAA